MNSHAQVVDALLSTIDACQKALIELGAEGVALTVGILKSVLGPRGEYTLPGLPALNAAYRAKWPTGYTDQVGDPGDANTSPTRIPLHLVESVIDARALERTDLSPELRESIHKLTWNDAWGTYMLAGQKDETTGLTRFMPLWLDGVAPAAPGLAAPVLVPPTHWPTDGKVLAAIARWYEITYGPLA